MLKGYKTLIVNGATAILPVVDMILNNGQLLGGLLGPKGAIILSVFGLVNVLLRWVTSTPVFKAE